MTIRTLYLPALIVAGVLLACLAAVATLLAVSREAESTFPGKNGKIAFVSTRHGKTGGEDIYTMNPSGTAVYRLTNFSGSDFEPAWSPDGSKIAFMSYRHSGGSGSVYRLYTMNARGTRVERPTHDAREDSEPAWSPGGSKIAFVSDRDGTSAVKAYQGPRSSYEIYTMNQNGTGLERLTNNHAADFNPDWQPLSPPDTRPFKVEGSA